MQRKVIALAIAGFVSSAAYAQSTSVILYGIIDQNYTYSYSKSSGGDKKFSGMRDGASAGANGSRFGVRGEEALGGGLKAVFTVEFGYEGDSNTVLNQTRQAFVGLSGNFGTLTAGRQYNVVAGHMWFRNVSHAASGFMPSMMLQGQGGATIRSMGGNSRQDNVIKYWSPNFSGLNFGVSYSFGESTRTLATAWDPKASVKDNGRWAVGMNYSNGPLGLSAAYALTQSVRTAAVQPIDQEGKDISEWYVGGNYDFKVVKIFGTYQQLKNKNDTVYSTATATSGTQTLTKSKMWSLGLSAPIGKGSLMFEYARIDYRTDNNPNVSDRRNGNSKGWGIAYRYDLSKRTALYSYASQIKHGDKAYCTVSGGICNPAGLISGTAIVGEKQTNFSVGVRHIF
jgi:predicted porin